MGRLHHFHTDHRGHSITVTVRSAPGREVELLVDGKTVGLHHPRAAGSTLVAGELPDDPPLVFAVAVHVPRFGSRVPRCSLLLGGAEAPMRERATV